MKLLDNFVLDVTQMSYQSLISVHQAQTVCNAIYSVNRAHSVIKENEADSVNWAHSIIKENEANSVNRAHSVIEENKADSVNQAHSVIKENKADNVNRAHLVIKENEANSVNRAHSVIEENEAKSVYRAHSVNKGNKEDSFSPSSLGHLRKHGEVSVNWAPLSLQRIVCTKLTRLSQETQCLPSWPGDWRISRKSRY